MKIVKTSSPPAATPSRQRAARASVHPIAPPPQDSAFIAGIPTSELTSKVREAIDSLKAEVANLRTDLKRAQQRVTYLEQLADEDALVPIYNRRAFVRELSRLVSYAERYGTPSSVLFFDVNGLKLINDTGGHAAGVAVLKYIAELLMQSVREFDIVGRLGGDEFGVILAHTDGATAEEKARALAATIADTPLVWSDETHPISVSFGIYTFTGEENVGEALDRTDQAMYAHKQAQRLRA